MNLLKEIFMKSPLALKKVIINIEAIRRDSFRRWGSYQKIYNNITIENIFPLDFDEIHEEKFKELFEYVKANVPAYTKYNGIKSFKDFEQLPITVKEDIVNSVDDYISTEVNKKKMYTGKTSGSTGKPLVFYKDKEAVRLNYIYHDKMFDVLGFGKKEVKSRFSGVPLFDFKKIKPPFWIYIDRYKQLQFSPYHLNENNFSLYLDALEQYNVSYGTGYAQTWLFLAEYIMKNNYSPPRLKAIITDSEGLSNSQQNIIEQAFSNTVHQTYGLQEVGQIAFQCENRVYHVMPELAYVEILDTKSKQVNVGETGEIVVTSFSSKQAPFIRYATGDLAVLGKNECACGWGGQILEDIQGRIDDYVLTTDNKKINRLSHIIKPAKGVLNSQIIQIDRSNIQINIIPSQNFDSTTMDEVIKQAKVYLGQININWSLVNELEKTSNGKIKHVIRKF